MSTKNLDLRAEIRIYSDTLPMIQLIESIRLDFGMLQFPLVVESRAVSVWMLA